MTYPGPKKPYTRRVDVFFYGNAFTVHFTKVDLAGEKKSRRLTSKFSQLGRLSRTCNYWQMCGWGTIRASLDGWSFETNDGKGGTRP